MLKKLSKKVLYSTFFIACYLTCQSALAAQIQCPKLSQFKPSQIFSSTVKWLPDGDTIHTQDNKQLRLLHINTPELNPTSIKPAQPFALAAKNKLQQLIGSSKKILWVYDKKKQDKYKRELALVFNQQGVFLNARLVVEGLAHSLVILPNQRYWHCIKTAENNARTNQKGIWSNKKAVFKNSRQIKAKQGFQLVSGKITKIINSKKNRWLILEDHLWVGISRKDFQYFESSQLNYSIGDRLSLRGYAYISYDKLRMKLRHPSMLY